MFFPTESIPGRLQCISGALLVFSLLLVSGCLHDPQGISPEPELDLSGFAMIWDSYETSYPLFLFKGTDWMELCREYYPQAVDCATEEELRGVITEMLAELQDPAIIIYSMELQDTIYTFEKEFQPNVDTQVLMENYLEPGGFQGYVDGFGWCDPAVLPYAFFDEFPTQGDTLAVAALDSFVSNCVYLGVPALILDVRMNPGDKRAGFHNFNHTAMGRFTSKARVCAWYRTRVGPEYGQYHDWRPWIVPAGPAQFTGTVYLLVGGGCTQAAEDMAVNMAHFPNVVILGDTTGGSVTEMGGSPIPLGIQGGWVVQSAVSTILTSDKDWVEEAGFPPDILVEATPEDFAAGVDPVMEYAMGLVQGRGHP